MPAQRTEQEESSHWLFTLARNVLLRYGVAAADLRLIRHNENAAFNVRDHATGLRYLLRVHRPASANILGLQHTFEGLCAEAEVLRTFRQGTGIPLQQPVINDVGLYVTSGFDDVAGAAVPCTLLTWVDGDALGVDDPRLAELMPQIGSTVAKLHRFARTWHPQTSLPRPIYDFAKYRYLVDGIGVGVRQGLFTQAQYEVVLSCMRVVQGFFAGLGRADETWGIIHADLGLGNWVLASSASAAQPVPIDWCFSGYGPYLFDVGGPVIGYQPRLRRAYLAGYQNESHELSPAEMRFCDACSLLSIFGAVGFHISNPMAHEWIARRMPFWTGEYCRLFLAGESPMRADE